MQTIRKHASPGTVLGVAAIVIALAGTSIAANKVRPSANTVGAKALKTPITRTATASISPGTSGEATVTCQGQEQVISGGTRFNVVSGVGVDYAHMQGNGWLARGFNFLATPVIMTVEAYCLPK